MSAIVLKNIALDGAAKDILIKDGLISKIADAGTGAVVNAAAEVMECNGFAAIPGFVNMHTHAGMTMMRGLGEDIDFSTWIEKIWKYESQIDTDFIYASTKLGCLEMIKSGTCSVNDQYWHFPVGIKAANDCGIRIATGYDFMDFFDKEKAAKQRDECEKSFADYGASHIYVLNIHAIYTVSPETIVWAQEFARRHGVRLQIHLCETRQEVEDCKSGHKGLTPVEYVNELGLLGPDLIAAHTLWLSEKDIELLGQNKVNCVHNINSNTKLSSGYRFLYNELRDAGANICIGTDGCASSNNLDMMETMKTSALFQKAWRDDPTSWNLEELMRAATLNGAKALGINSGTIEEGKDADIAIVDTRGYAFVSYGGFLPNLIYSAHSDCIDSLICRGKFVMRGRKVAGEEEIITEARKALK